jgi:hypothetical protein
MQPEVKTQLVKVTMLNAAFTILENAIFAIVRHWDKKVLLGSLWGLLIASLYFLMITLNSVSALKNSDSSKAELHMKGTYFLRMGIVIIGIIVALKSKSMNWIAALIPLQFPSLSAAVTGLNKKR